MAVQRNSFVDAQTQQRSRKITVTTNIDRNCKPDLVNYSGFYPLRRRDARHVLKTANDSTNWGLSNNCAPAGR
jgi:hypothetical protein